MEVYGQLQPSTTAGETQQVADEWKMPNFQVLIRVHHNPREALFIPTKENCPIPLEWLEIHRTTTTDFDHGELREIQDFCTQAERNGNRVLDEPWTGKTMFNIVPKALAKERNGNLVV